jgi:hypothetical protein
MRTLASSALLGVLLSGCGTTQVYEGQQLPRSEVAVIIGDSKLNFITPMNVIIRRVDGKTVSVGSNKVEILPGPHDLEVQCEMLNIGSFNTHQIHFEAVAGKTYVLAVRVLGDKCEGIVSGGR